MRIESIPGHLSRVGAAWIWRIAGETAPWSRAATRQECADKVQDVCSRNGLAAAFGRKQAFIALAYLYYGMADDAAQACAAVDSDTRVHHALFHDRYEFPDGSALVSNGRAEFIIDPTKSADAFSYLDFLSPEEAAHEAAYVNRLLAAGLRHVA